jgi:nuclear cap-binding protein subunit 1
LVAETLFGEMLALPAAPHPAVFYHVVIQDLCAAIATFPKMMAKVVGAAFSQIGRMDGEARERLADWMAHHLSCFDLAWPWRSWEHVAEQDPDHPQRRFCASVVKRLLRSCYRRRVEDSLPETLKRALLPRYVGDAESSNGPDTPGLNVAYLASLASLGTFSSDSPRDGGDGGDDGGGGTTDALGYLATAMRAKTSSENLGAWFEKSGARARLGDASCAALVTAAALRHGQKCITHHDVLLKRYRPLLLEFQRSDADADADARRVGDRVGDESIEKPHAGAAILEAASGVWSGTHPRMAVAAVSRLRALEIIPPAATARWLETRAFDFSVRSLLETRWGSADALETAREAVEVLVARWRLLESRRVDFGLKRTRAERAASVSSAAAEDAEQRDALTQRDELLRAAQAHRDRASVFRREEEEAAFPAERARKIAAETAASVGAAIVRGALSIPGIKEAAASVRRASATGRDAGRDALPETHAFRALQFASAALRGFRFGGAVVEAATAAEARNAPGDAGDVAAALGEAMCGPGGFDAAVSEQHDTVMTEYASNAM